MEDVAGYALKISGVASFSKTIVKNLPEILSTTRAGVKEAATGTMNAGRSYATGVATAEGATLAAGAAGVVAAGAMVVRSCANADDLRHLSDLDAMDVGVTSLLDLDSSFKQQEVAKHPGINPQALTTFMRTSEYGRAALPELQAAADAGSRDALDALRVGKESYFKMHPEREARFKSDIAYSKGFDSVLWAASRSDGDSRLKDIRAKLDARDARASQVQGSAAVGR
jgi:hypothetical protein